MVTITLSNRSVQHISDLAREFAEDDKFMLSAFDVQNIVNTVIFEQRDVEDAVLDLILSRDKAA